MAKVAIATNKESWPMSKSCEFCRFWYFFCRFWYSWTFPGSLYAFIQAVTGSSVLRLKALLKVLWLAANHRGAEPTSKGHWACRTALRTLQMSLTFLYAPSQSLRSVSCPRFCTWIMNFLYNNPSENRMEFTKLKVACKYASIERTCASLWFAVCCEN